MIEKNELESDQLIVGTFPVVMDAVTLKSGVAYKRGAVLGIITAGGKATLVDSSKSDGSQTPHAILVEDTDATSADAVAPVYLTGVFNQGSLIFGGTDTAATHKAALRSKSIFIKSVGN